MILARGGSNVSWLNLKLTPKTRIHTNIAQYTVRDYQTEKSLVQGKNNSVVYEKNINQNEDNKHRNPRTKLQCEMR